MGFWRLAAHLAAALALVSARSSTGDEVLVVLEPSLKQADYSRFFGGLQGQCPIRARTARSFSDRDAESGYNLTFRAPKDVSPAVIVDGEPAFNHLILFAPETKGEQFAFTVKPRGSLKVL
jgi:oligosaccharyltransferase complex subunit beta